MAAPNIVGITTLVGFSTFTTLSNTNATSIVSNAAASNKVLKVTSVIVANTSDSNTEYVHVSLNLLLDCRWWWQQIHSKECWY